MAQGIIAYEVAPQAARFATLHAECDNCGVAVKVTRKLWNQLWTTGWRTVSCPECGHLGNKISDLRNAIRRAGNQFPKSVKAWQEGLADAEAQLASRRK